MRQNIKIVGAVLALIITVAALQAYAGEGRTPIWQPRQINPGGEGKYIVTRDITAQPGAPVIEVLPGTVAVDIDLNGFTLYGLDDDIIRATQVDSLTIRNGSLMFGPGTAILVDGARKVVVEDVKIQFVEQRGISLQQVLNFAIRRNVITNTAQDSAIYVEGITQIDPVVPTEGSIEDNLLRESMRGITVYFGSSVGIRNNRIEAPSADGIFISPGPNDVPYGCVACLVVENTIQSAGANGMWLSHFESSKVYNNTVTLCRSEGIWLDELSDDNLILDNVSSQNQMNGMLVYSNQNHIERNVLNTNGLGAAGPAWGLYLTGFSNVYRGNLARGNSGPAASCPGFPATNDFCDGTGGANTSPFNQPPTLQGDNLMPGLL